MNVADTASRVRGSGITPTQSQTRTRRRYQITNNRYQTANVNVADKMSATLRKP